MPPYVGDYEEFLDNAYKKMFNAREKAFGQKTAREAMMEDLVRQQATILKSRQMGKTTMRMATQIPSDMAFAYRYEGGIVDRRDSRADDDVVQLVDGPVGEAWNGLPELIAKNKKK